MTQKPLSYTARLLEQISNEGKDLSRALDTLHHCVSHSRKQTMNILLGIIAIFLAALLYQEHAHRMKALEARITRLEESKQKRINYESLIELENAIAAYDVLAREIEIKQNVLDNLREHLLRARNPGKRKGDFS